MSRLAVGIAGNAAFSSLRFLAGVTSGLLASILLARRLGPQEFGVYRLALSLVWIVEFTSVLAFPNATTRFVSELAAGPEAGRARGALRFFLVRSTTVCLLVLAAFLAVRGPVARFYHEERLAPLLAVATLSVLPGLWSGLLGAALQGVQRFRALGFTAVVQGVVNVGGIALILRGGGGLRELFLLLVALNVLGLGMLAGAWRSQSRALGPVRPCPAALRRRMWRYGLTMGAIAITGGVLSERLEVFFLGRFWGAAEVGFYSLSFTLAMHARRLGPAAVGEVLFPVISSLESRGDRWGVANAYVQSVRHMAMLALPLAVGGVVFARPLLHLLFGAAYGPAATPLAVLLFGAALVALTQPATSVILSRDRQRFLLVTAVVTAGVNVLLDLLVIPVYGAVGAAAANVAIQALLLIVQSVFVIRVLPATVPLASLARTLAAVVLALLPAAALRLHPALGETGGALAGVLGFVGLYPLLLARLGVLGADDIGRLRAVSGALPAYLRRPADLALGVLAGWAARAATPR